MGKIINPYRFGTTLKTDLISLWEFNETTGSDAFDAHDSYDGTINNCSLNYNTGIANLTPGYDFNSTSSYVESSLTTTYGKFSYSMWIYLDSFGGGTGGRLITKGETAEGILFVSGGYSRIAYSHYWSGDVGQWVSPENSILTGNLYHIVFIYDSSSLSNDAIIYINGSSVTVTRTFVPTGTAPSTSNPYVVGGIPGNATRAFDGRIDQVGIWSKELTSDEVSLLYNSGDGLAYTSW